MKQKAYSMVSDSSESGAVVVPDTSATVARIEKSVSVFLKEHSRAIRASLFIVFVLGYSAYFAYAIVYSIDQNIELIVLTCFVTVYLLYDIIRDKYGDIINQKAGEPLSSRIKKIWPIGRWVFYGLLVVGFIIFLALDVAPRNPQYLISLVGMCFFVLVSFVFSTSPAKVPWMTVFSGVTLQIIMGLLVIRWPPGQAAVRWLSDVITGFLHYAFAGCEYVFGESFRDHSFAMEVLPILCWFMAVVSVLYFYGILQRFIPKLGGLIAFVMGTSTPESFVAASNIFLGPDNSIIAIKSMVPDMSTSEIHSLLSCSLATVDGGMIPVFESLGVPASHIVSASFMSAPAALAISKTLYPEDGVVNRDRKLKFEEPTERHALEAFANGAISAVPIIGGILATLIAFISLLSFINTTLTWMGHRVGLEDLTLEGILGVLFMPMVFLMGVEWEDCRLVGQLVGLKTIINEFVAYVYLAELISNRKAGLEPSISERSETIAAYALCGFSNIGTVGFMISFMSNLAPLRKALSIPALFFLTTGANALQIMGIFKSGKMANETGDIARVAMRSLVSGSIACFMTACVAACKNMSEKSKGSAKRAYGRKSNNS